MKNDITSQVIVIEVINVEYIIFTMTVTVMNMIYLCHIV